MTLEQAVGEPAVGVDPNAEPAGVVGGTTPYPWPYDGVLTLERTALIVAGWNDEWWSRCHDPAGVVGAIGRLARGAVDTVITIDHGKPVAVHGVHPSSPRSRCRRSPDRARSPRPASTAFFGGPLDAVLRSRGTDHLLLVGLGLESTVHSTMRSANDHGYECLLVVDACAPLDPAALPHAVSMVDHVGRHLRRRRTHRTRPRRTRCGTLTTAPIGRNHRDRYRHEHRTRPPARGDHPQ